MTAVENVHRPAWKDEEISHIKADVKTHDVVAVVSIHGIPARQFQDMRAELKNVAKIQVARNTLIHRALEQSGESTLKLFENVEGQTALIFTNLNPFKLFKLIENSKTPAPAKAGEKAPRDIIVEKGPTSFRPGPIVGDLQNAGIPAAIEKGKIVIRETKTVVKTGEPISARLADVLQRLEIYPMEVGLYLRAAYDGDVIYTSEDLKIDEQAFFNQVVSAVSNALNLSINIGYPTSLTVETLLQKGTFEGMTLGLEAEIFEPEVLKILLLRAHKVAMWLVNELPNDALDEDLIALKGATMTLTQSPEAEQAVEEKHTQEDEEANETKDAESGMAGLGALFE
ncbi:MAG: 50S ribosomal protein L10 [Euryarchaeota archaeon]|jgi:large subunit ribosomal protein L10|nr:50S ribosomal protein L10 [Euryarchaeota archaeon]